MDPSNDSLNSIVCNKKLLWSLIKLANGLNEKQNHRKNYYDYYYGSCLSFTENCNVKCNL